MTRALRLSLLVAVPGVLAFAADNKPSAMNDALIVHLKDARWTAPKAPEIPAGAMVAPVASDPNGPNVVYAKFPAGYTLPLHWHSATEYSVVLSGKVQLTVAGKTSELEPGSYIVIPPRAQHMVKCAPGADCLALTRRAGPVDYNWVK